MLRFFLPLLLGTSFAFSQELPAGAFARLGGTALRHPEKPLALAFRAGSTELASLGADGTVKIWNTKTGKALHTLRKKDSQANGMAYSANGAFLAVHFDENLLRVYDARKYEITHTAAVKMLDGMTITDDGTLVAGLRFGKPAIVQTGNGIDGMELFGGTAVAIAPDGKSVALVQKDGDDFYPDILEVPSGKRMLKLLRKGAPNTNRIAYAPDSRTLAVSSDGAGPIIVMQLGKEEPLAKIDGTGPVSFANATTLVGRKAGKLAVWNTDGNTDGKLLYVNIGRDMTVFALSGDGKTAATDSGALLGSPRIRLWNVTGGKELNFEKEFSFGSELVGGLIGVIPHPKMGVIVVTTDNPIDWRPGELNIYELGGLQKARQEDSGLRQASSPDGKLKVSAVHDEKAGHSLTVEFDKVRRVELDSPVLGVAVHPEAKSFAAITRDGAVRVWDYSGELLWTSRLARSLRAGIAYSPDGEILAATSVIRVALFESGDGKEIAMIPRQWEDGPYTSVCFNNDGSLIAAGTQGSAGSGVVFETASKKLVQRCESHSGSAIGVAFAAKSDVLVTAHADDSLIAWKAVPPVKAGTDPAKLWDALLSDEAEVAWPAMMALVEAKEKAVSEIAEGLKAEAKKPEELLRKKRAKVILARIGTPEARKVAEGIR